MRQIVSHASNVDVLEEQAQVVLLPLYPRVEERVDISGLVFEGGRLTSRLVFAARFAYSSGALHGIALAETFISVSVFEASSRLRRCDYYQELSTDDHGASSLPSCSSPPASADPHSSVLLWLLGCEKREKQGTHPISGRKPPECGRR